MYAGYIFLAINISQNANAFSVITCIFAILLSGCIEDFFREDVCNRQWYRLLGEKYSGLWCKKMIVELKIQFVLFAAYLICTLIHKYDVKIAFMVLIYMVECGLCWVTYFALYYVKMKKIYNFRNDEIVCGNVFNYSSGDKYIVMCMVVCTRSQEVE